LINISFKFYCGVVSPFIFLEKTKQKIVSAFESLRFQGRSQRQVEQLIAWLSPDVREYKNHIVYCGKN